MTTDTKKIQRPIHSATDLTADETKCILRRENELRLCDDTHDKFGNVNRSDSGGWIQVVEELQRQVCHEFGLSTEVGLVAMRQAHILLPNDPEINEISLYRKYNRCRDGDLKVGDKPPNVTLFDLKTKAQVSLLSFIPKMQPLVIIAASYT